MTFSRSDPDLIVFALKQLHEGIERLGDGSRYPLQQPGRYLRSDLISESNFSRLILIDLLEDFHP